MKQRSFNYGCLVVVVIAIVLAVIVYGGIGIAIRELLEYCGRALG